MELLAESTKKLLKGIDIEYIDGKQDSFWIAKCEIDDNMMAITFRNKGEAKVEYYPVSNIRKFHFWELNLDVPNGSGRVMNSL